MLLNKILVKFFNLVTVLLAEVLRVNDLAGPLRGFHHVDDLLDLQLLQLLLVNKP